MQVIYTIFEQEPADELLPAALEHNVGILVRVVFDEGILTSKYTVNLVEQLNQRYDGSEPNRRR